MKLLENKKIVTVILVLNCIVICILAGYLVYAKIDEFRTEEQLRETIKPETISINESDGDLSSIYMSLLQGSYFDLEDNVHFNFKENGEYSGFFDSENPDVSGYLYSIDVSNDAVYLQIFNEDKSKVVQYEAGFDNEENVVLKHPDMETPITLSY